MVTTLKDCRKLAKSIELTVSKTFDPKYPYYLYNGSIPVMRFTNLDALKRKLLILTTVTKKVK